MSITETGQNATRENVASFLQDFNVKLTIWGVVFRDDRGKNARALLELDILPAFREQILKELKPEDYSEGPKKELLNGGSAMWIFGKTIKKQEVYIKITLGFENARAICISFHIAEYPMRYPLKNKS